MIKNRIPLYVFLLCSAFVSPSFGWERESFYSDKICAEYGGAPTTLPSRLKPDCETEFLVMEFDWAKSPKHYECIGQAIVYQSQTDKVPVCVLLARTYKEYTFGLSMQSAMDQANVILRVIKLQ